MHMMVVYENGSRADAVVLAVGENRMRVVLRGSRDTVELRLLKEQWMTEEGDAIDIEALVAGERIFWIRSRLTAA
jgi:hypothetical protein